MQAVAEVRHAQTDSRLVCRAVARRRRGGAAGAGGVLAHPGRVALRPSPGRHTPPSLVAVSSPLVSISSVLLSRIGRRSGACRRMTDHGGIKRTGTAVIVARQPQEVCYEETAPCRRCGGYPGGRRRRPQPAGTRRLAVLVDRSGPPLPLGRMASL